MCSSGEEEYDSRAGYDTVVPLPASLNAPIQFGSYFSLVSQSHHQTPNPSLFDPSPNNYLHALSQSQPAASVPNSEPNCTQLPDLPSSSSSFLSAGNQSGGGCSREASQQLGSVQEHDNYGGVWASTTNAVRNSKKRSRASRRAPTTVLTTDTSNFRSMVQEFTGIPAPPFSASPYSRRLNPFRPSPRNHHPPNPSLPLSSSLTITTTTAAATKNMVDAIASTTNIPSTTTTNNSPASHQLLSGLGFAFQTPPLHPFTIPLPARFSSKSQPSGSGYEPCSTESPFSEWAINTTNSWPSHF